MATQTEVETDLPTEEQDQPREGLIERLRNRIDPSRAGRPVTLPTGQTVSGAMGRFLEAHPGSRYLGTDIFVEAIEHDAGLERKVPWDRRRHRPAQRIVRLREYAELPDGTAVQRRSATQTDNSQPPRPEIWMSEDRKEPILIGFTMSRAALERIGALAEQEEGNEDVQQPQ
jgi:hypothetical protein